MQAFSLQNGQSKQGCMWQVCSPEGMTWDSTRAAESRLCPVWASSNISMSGLVWYYGSPGVTVTEVPPLPEQCPQMQFNMASKYFSLELCLHRPGFKADRPMVSQQPRHTATNTDKLMIFFFFFICLFF